jgi:hypothetical protein
MKKYISKTEALMLLSIFLVLVIAQFVSYLVRPNFEVSYTKYYARAGYELTLKHMWRVKKEGIMEWCPQNPPSDNEADSTRLQRKLCGCSKETYINGQYDSSLNTYFMENLKKAPEVHYDLDDYFVDEIVFKPLVGEEVRHTYADETFNYADYINNRRPWTTLSKMYYYGMCLVKNIVDTFFVSLSLFFVGYFANEIRLKYARKKN